MACVNSECILLSRLADVVRTRAKDAIERRLMSCPSERTLNTHSSVDLPATNPYNRVNSCSDISDLEENVTIHITIQASKSPKEEVASIGVKFDIKTVCGFSSFFISNISTVSFS